MKYYVTHTTRYQYSETVPLGHNQTHLVPRSFTRQRCMSNRLLIQPVPMNTEQWTDFFGNPVHFFALEEEHRELTIAAYSEVEVYSPSYPAPAVTPPWEDVRADLARPRGPLLLDAAQFTYDSPYVQRDPMLGKYAETSFPPRRPLLEAALDLNARIFREFKYDPTATCVNTPPREVFEKRRGVCQDFAHLAIACLRTLGLAARYVSGYLLTDPPQGQPRLIGADASHAWLAVFCPGFGWLDLDPTNNQMPAMRHVTLGWGRDYGDISPIKGLFLGGGQHTMSVAVDVTPVVD